MFIIDWPGSLSSDFYRYSIIRTNNGIFNMFKGTWYALRKNCTNQRLLDILACNSANKPYFGKYRTVWNELHKAMKNSLYTASILNKMLALRIIELLSLIDNWPARTYHTDIASIVMYRRDISSHTMTIDSLSEFRTEKDSFWSCFSCLELLLYSIFSYHSCLNYDHLAPQSLVQMTPKLAW